MIELQNVTIRTGTFMLREISFEVPAGCYAVLMGSTGIGKTTLLETICGLRSVQHGQILLNGCNMTHAPPAVREIGYVPQDLALFPTMTVQDHLEFALRLRRTSQLQRTQRVKELARLLHIEGLLSRKITKLSGGEAQRVALGRALSFRPSVLLLDEPLSALDEAIRCSLQSLLQEVQRTTGVTVLHVTHQREEAERLAERLYVFERGEVRWVNDEDPAS